MQKKNSSWILFAKNDSFMIIVTLRKNFLILYYLHILDQTNMLRRKKQQPERIGTTSQEHGLHQN